MVNDMKRAEIEALIETARQNKDESKLAAYCRLLDDWDRNNTVKVTPPVSGSGNGTTVSDDWLDDLSEGFFKWSTVVNGQDVKLKILERPHPDYSKKFFGKDGNPQKRYVGSGEVDGAVYTVTYGTSLRRALKAFLMGKAETYPIKVMVCRQGTGTTTRWTVRDWQ